MVNLHATAFGDKADFTCGMTAKEDKKTPARVGREPELILAQPWERPSLAGGVCALILPILCECCISFYLTSYKRCNSLLNWEVVFHKILLSNIL